MAKIKLGVIHCSATPEGRDIRPEDILLWHTGPKKDGHRGWKKPGYRDFVTIDGGLHNLVPYNQDDKIDNWEISNGARGYNDQAIHICYAGGSSSSKESWMKHYPPKDTRTNEQLETLELYVKYHTMVHPDIKWCGHNQLSNKACPSFDVAAWLRAIGINEKNII